MNIARGIEQGRQAYPDHPALIFEGRTITYAALDAEASRMAGVLRGLGITRGDRVALLLPNVPDFAFAYYGALKLGAIVVSINVGLTAEEIAFVLRDSGAVALVTTAAYTAAVRRCTIQVLVVDDQRGTGRSFADAVDALEAASAADVAEAAKAAEAAAAAEYVSVFAAIELPHDAPAAIVYTSGTTGAPKGATLSHGNVTFAAAAKQRYLDIRPDDRLLLFLPLHHCFGQNAILNAALLAGATVVLQRSFDAERVLAACADSEQGVTMVFGVPATYTVLLDRAGGREALGGVRYCFSAAAPLPLAIEQGWREQFGLVLHQGYGLTETSPFASYNHLTAHRPGSIGVPIEGVEMRVVDVFTRQPLAAGETGEIVIRGPNVMLGYWNRTAETAEVVQDGWFHSGDIGRMDDAGYFFIEDRLKDMVIVGGSNVYPAEVENVLHQHPAIADVAVFGVPAPVVGERVWAAIVPAAGIAAPAERDLIAWCRTRMAAYKVPARFEIVDELPRNRTGKVLKRVLRERHAAAATAATGAAATASAVQHWLSQWLASALGELLPLDVPLAEAGVTSVIAVELAGALEEWLGRPVSPTIAWQCPTIRTMARQVAHDGVRSAADERNGLNGNGGINGVEGLDEREERRVIISIETAPAINTGIDWSALATLSEADAEALLTAELRRLQG